MHSLAPFITHRTAVRVRLPIVLLVTLLQRTPVLHVARSAGEIITRSPVAIVLKSFTATLAALGAVNSLAGATQLVATRSSPVTLTEGEPIAPIAFTVTDTINLGSWRVGGTLPPGLRLISSTGTASLTGPGVLDATASAPAPGGDDPYATPGDGAGNTMTLPVLVGTPTQAGSYTFTLQAYQLGGLSGFTTTTFSFTVNVAASTAPTTRPAFSQQPSAQTVAAGGTVTLAAAATGTPAPTYQWFKDGAAITGATSATLTIANAQSSHAGSYRVVATNSAGDATSNTVVVTVNSPTTVARPVIARQPRTQTVAAGSTVVFSVEATGTPAPAYQWQRNGTNINGATGPLLVLKATAADAGTYSVLVSNSAGSVPSANATLAVSSDTNVGRLINLSILTDIPAAGESGAFTLGYVVGGASATTPKPLVIRAAGPSLGALGVPGTAADPKLELFAGATKTAENDNWGGSSGLAAALAAVGAFPYASAGSLDAAAAVNITTRDNSVKVSATAAGTVIAEIYDATPGGSFSAATPRLINVSVSKQINTGGSLTAGFVVGGNTARSVLVRAVGPGLAAFGVGGTMPDPQLVLQSGSSSVAENDNWGGSAQVAAVFDSVGAFRLPQTSGDAVLLVTLAPGSYTAQVKPAGAGGSTLIEVYEVP